MTSPSQRQLSGELSSDKNGRYVALWVPNWPLVSLLLDAEPRTPAAVINRGKLVVLNPAARQCGIRCGMSRVQGQYYCPELQVFSQDSRQEESSFQPLLEVFDTYAADVSVVRPGLAFASAIGASKWARGEHQLASGLIEEIAISTGAESQVGIANGVHAALIAARLGQIIPSAETQHFLDQIQLKQIVQDLPARVAQQVEPTLQVLERLGVETVGAFRGLGKSAVFSRFGSAGATLWSLSSAAISPVQSLARRSAEIRVDTPVDPVANTLDHAMNAASRASSALADQLQQNHSYASIVRIALETERGRTNERTWAMLDATSPLQVTKRITWQLRGWLASQGEQAEDPDGLKAIRLAAIGATKQPSTELLWGGDATSWKTSQTVEQVQELLGEQAVLVPRVHGGFDPRSRVSYVRWGASSESVSSSKGAWEGGVSLSPTVLFASPLPAVLMGARTGGESLSNSVSSLSTGSRQKIWVTKRGLLNGVPLLLEVQRGCIDLPAGEYPLEVNHQLWVVRGRWWKPEDKDSGPRCYLQVFPLHDFEEHSLLLIARAGRWRVEGIHSSRLGKITRGVSRMSS